MSAFIDHCYIDLVRANGGMGAVAPMKRSAADVEISANSGDWRGRFLLQIAASPARHDRQISTGGELMQ